MAANELTYYSELVATWMSHVTSPLGRYLNGYQPGYETVRVPRWCVLLFLAY